jgi:hypothetical protein
MSKRLGNNNWINLLVSVNFYNWILWGSIGYSILREIIQKTLFVYYDYPFKMPREIIGSIFFLFAVCSIVTSWLLRRKMNKNYLIFLTIIIIISFANEFRFFIYKDDYSIIESLTTGQLYYVSKVVFPFLFLGFWPLLDVNKAKTNTLVKTLEKLFLVNAGLIVIVGLFFGSPLVESYPLTNRWGYCGVLFDRQTTQFIYGFLLINSWKNKNTYSWKSLIFLFCLLVTGQKSGLLWITLFFVIVLVSHPALKTVISLIAISVVILSPFLIPKLVPFSSFWQGAYDEHGTWGVFFSLRNELVVEAINSSNLGIIDLLFGGIVRYPTHVEILPADLFFYFGIFGLVIKIWFLPRWVPSWKWGIPLIVACFTGGIIGSYVLMLIYGIIIGLVRDRD